MSKKIFIVSSSPRKNGNSDFLAEEFARGAREAGHAVEKVNSARAVFPVSSAANVSSKTESTPCFRA